MKLSILIPSTESRRSQTEILVAELKKQTTNKEAEVLVNYDQGFVNGGKSIGTKRNELLKQATGQYVIFIDSDDFPTPHYVQLIYEATNYGIRDIITFDFNRFVDGIYERTFVVNRFFTNGNDWCSKYWAQNFNPSHKFSVNNQYYHLMAVKKELADQVTFIDANNDEDNQYSRGLIPLIKTEYHIHHALLNVFFDTKKIQNI